MPSRGKGRSQGGTVPVNPTKRSRKAGAKRPQMLRSTPLPEESMNEQLEAPDVMDILMDMSNRLQAIKLFMQETQEEKSAAAARRSEIPTQGRPVNHTPIHQNHTTSKQPSTEHYSH